VVNAEALTILNFSLTSGPFWMHKCSGLTSRDDCCSKIQVLKRYSAFNKINSANRPNRMSENQAAKKGGSRPP
jgi:hypothetical protein